jgi:hypothetical protein
MVLLIYFKGYYIDGKEIIKPLVITDEKKVSNLDPYEYIYGSYKAEYHHLFVDDENPDCFHPQIQLKILMMILEGAKHNGGCALAIDTLVSNGKIKSIFPLHHRNEKKELEAKWLVCCQWPWNQPFDDIKEYFGEAIGLYFIFISHLSSWLYVPGLVGIPLQLVVWAKQDFRSIHISHIK